MGWSSSRNMTLELESLVLNFPPPGFFSLLFCSCSEDTCVPGFRTVDRDFQRSGAGMYPFPTSLGAWFNTSHGAWSMFFLGGSRPAVTVL